MQDNWFVLGVSIKSRELNEKIDENLHERELNKWTLWKLGFTRRFEITAGEAICQNMIEREREG